MPNSQNRIDYSGIKALYKASTLGVVFIASARAPKGIFFLFEEISLKPRAIIALNGAVTYINGKIINKIAMPREIVEKIINNYKDDVEIWLYSESEWFSTNTNSKFCAKEASGVGFEPQPIDKFSNNTEVLKMTLLSDNWDNLEIPRYLLNSKISVSSSNVGYKEIYSSDAGKYKAMYNIINHLNIDNPFIFAIGDSDNDIDILKKADFSCTVGNATGKAKQYSKFCSDRYYGEGALDCILKFIKSITEV